MLEMGIIGLEGYVLSRLEELEVEVVFCVIIIVS